MSVTSVGSQGPVPQAAGGQGAERVPGTADHVKVLTDVELLAETRNLLRQAQEFMNANAAPNLPPINFDLLTVGESLAFLVHSVTSKTQAVQNETAKTNLKAIEGNIDKNREATIKQIDDWVKACQDAARKARGSGLWGCIAKVAAFVVSVALVVAAGVATAATAGAAAPLLALAVMAMIGAGTVLGSEISEREGGPSFSVAQGFEQLGNMISQELCGSDKFGKLIGGAMAYMTCAFLADPSTMGMFAEGTLTACGVDDPQTLMIANIVATVVCVVLIAVLSANLGAANSAANAGAKGAAAGTTTANTTTSAMKTADTAADTADAAAKAAEAAKKARDIKLAQKLLTGFGQISAGTTGIVQAAAKMEEAEAQLKADKAGVARMLSDMIADFYQQEWQTGFKALERLTEMVPATSEFLNEFLDTLSEGATSIADNYA